MKVSTRESAESEMQSEIKRIANAMAVRFDENITNKEFIVWQIRASGLLFDYSRSKDYNNENHSSDFLTSFGYYFIPSLLDAKTSKERIAALEIEIPDIFIESGYKNLKIILAEIGSSFLSTYSKLTFGDGDIQPLMKILACLMELSEMYQDYEYCKRKDQEERKLLAA